MTIRRPATLVVHLASLFALGLPARLHAQGPPIHTDTPIMLGIEGRGVRTFLRVTRLDRLLQDGDRIADPLDRSMTTWVIPVVAPYNITARMQAGVIAPFVSRNLSTRAGDANRAGVGDLSAYLKQLIVQVDRPAETFRVAVKGIVKLPTGDETGTLPLGTGTLDVGASAVAGWVRGRLGLYGETIYEQKGSKDMIDPGDRFAYNVAAGYRVLPVVYDRYPSPQLNAFIELNGDVTAKGEAAGARIPDTGGALVLLSPGLQYVGGRRWLIEASAQIPVLDHPNGSQLGRAWSASLGTRVLLF